MKRITLAAAAALFGCAAQAQTYHDAGSTIVPGVVPLVGCSTSRNCTAPVSSTNPLPVSGTFSASFSGFQPSATGSVGTPITATTGGAAGSLPSGTVVIATNAGATNTAYCQLGSSASTSAQPIAPNGGWFAFTVGSATQLACATSTSTTTVNLLGGAGLPTGTGGGGGGSSGGTVAISQATPGTTNAVAVTNINSNGATTASNGSPTAWPTDQFATQIAAINAGTAGFGLSWPSSGIANGTKGSGATAIINPMWAPDSSAPIAIASGTGYVEAVAGVSGQSIRVFGYQVTVSANTALTWGWSASTSCTSVTALSGAMLFIAGIGLQGTPVGGLSLTVPAGDTLCLSSGTSASVQGILQYQQSP